MRLKPIKTVLLALFSIIILISGIRCAKKGVNPKPTITSISPTSGPPNTIVTITGTDFTPTIIDNTVSFNTGAATITGATSTTITALAPASGSTGPIKVANSNGTAIGPVFTYTSPKPTITSISPASGPPNTTVTITGTNFKPAIADNTVTFNTGAATIIGATATTITALAPVSGSTGTVKVGTTDGTVIGPVFTYTSAKPTITSISPASGPVNTTVTITGTNFKTTIADNTVTFNTGAATIIGATATTITALAPASGSTGAIKVGTPDGIATGPVFTYISLKPTITSISPVKGPINTTVVITGTNFKPNLIDNTVAFNTGAATIIGATATTITALAPASGSTGPVKVGTPDGSAIGPVFTYIILKPTITSISPTSGPANTIVKITGTNFKTNPADNTVTFNAAAATVTAATATTLTVLAPVAGTTGAVKVTTTDGSATGPVFTYISLKPTITSISPTSGPANTIVKITGTNFKANPADNTVTFNAIAATVTAATATTLTVSAPMAGTTGAVKVTTIDGSATGPVFTYISLKPTITSISPTSGPSNTIVKITGTNFKTTPANNTVTFNGAAATITAATATMLTVSAPASGSTGAVKVVTADGTATGPVFTYSASHDIYVLGQTASGFCYWKNGVRTDLPASANTLNAFVTSISVSGTDVYVGGSSGSPVTYPVYWKNGAMVTLPTNGQTGAVASVYVSGANVIAAGYQYSSGSGLRYLLYWKNGIATYLQNSAGNSIAAGLAAWMAVSGSDIYVSGNDTENSGNNINAALWKNQTPTILTTTSGSANGMFLSGGNIYLAGAESGICRYWKNGTPTLLSPNANGLRPGRIIYVSGIDVYVVGQANGAAKYWKNGTMVGLTTQEFNSGIATCVSGIGNDIYMGGSTSVDNGVWGYWANGTFITLTGCTNVADILVK